MSCKDSRWVRTTGRKFIFLCSLVSLLFPLHKELSQCPPLQSFKTVSFVHIFGVWFYFQYDLVGSASFRKSLTVSNIPKDLLTFSNMVIRRYSINMSFNIKICTQTTVAKNLVKLNTMRDSSLSKWRQCYLRKHN